MSRLNTEEKAMAELPVMDEKAESVDSVDVPDFLAEGDVNTVLLHQVAVAHLANRRQGNSSTKTRSEVRGSGRKIFRQKGLGRARMGSIRSSLRIGGGIAFGPRPRSYRQQTPKKMRQRALLAALRDKLQNGAVTLVREIPGDRDRPKTTTIVQLLDRLALSERKVVIVLPENDTWVYRSAKNLPRVSVTTSAQLHAYELMVHDAVLLLPASLTALAERVQPGAGAAPTVADDAEAS
jgi:large subunit ribosomal protein L4